MERVVDFARDGLLGNMINRSTKVDYNVYYRIILILPQTSNMYEIIKHSVRRTEAPSPLPMDKK